MFILGNMLHIFFTDCVVEWEISWTSKPTEPFRRGEDFPTSPPN